MENQVVTNLSKYSIEIFNDTFCSVSPLDYNNDIKLVYSSNRSTFGNKYVDDLNDYLMELLNYSDVYKDKMLEINDLELFYILLERLNKKDYIALPVYAYIHSGISLSNTKFGCNFDSGLIGFIYISKKDSITNYGKYRHIEKTIKFLEIITKEHSKCLNGDVYGYRLLDNQNNIIDNYGGYITDNPKLDMIDNIFDNCSVNLSKEEIKQLVEKSEILYS